MSAQITAEQLDFLIGLIGDGESMGENLRAIREALHELRDRRAAMAKLEDVDMVVPVHWEVRGGHSVLRADSEPFDIAWASEDPKTCYRDEVERAYGVIHLHEHSGNSGRLEPAS